MKDIDFAMTMLTIFYSSPISHKSFVMSLIYLSTYLNIYRAEYITFNRQNIAAFVPADRSQ